MNALTSTVCKLYFYYIFFANSKTNLN